MYIKNKEGEKVAKLYDYIAQNICQYFLYNKGNKKKNINNINNNKININNINNNNIKNIKSNLYDKKFFNGKEIIVQNNINNNLLKYSCNNNIKNNNNLYSLGEDKLYINKIKFTVFKTK